MEEPAAGPTDAKAKASAKPRQNKTPLQKEVLEASYQLNQHPSVEHRKALGDRIGLTEHEVQAWFTNRRRRDKQAEKKATVVVSGSAAGTPGVAAPSASVGASMGPGAASPVAGAPAGTLPHVPSAVSTPGGGSAGATSPKPKAPRAPKPPKVSPVRTPPPGPVPASPHAILATGAPAGLPRHVPPAHLAVPVQMAAAVSGQDKDENTEDADDDASDAAAAAWEGIRALCLAARVTLPVPYREDGPALGFLFDEPPMPGEIAVGVGNKRRRIVLGHDMVAEADEEGVKSVLLRRPGGGKPGVPGGGPVGVMTVAELEMRRRELQVQQQALDEVHADDPDFKASGRKAEDALKREQDRLRRELLRQQDKLERDRKREEEERGREMERNERDRKKMADKMERDRAKEEARKLKELEKMKMAEERELKRLEAAREKERKAEERRKAVEERKKEKESARALAQQERAVLRMRHREGAHGPPDDEELEYRKLLIAAGIDPATIADPDEDVNAPGGGGSGAASNGEGPTGAGASVTPLQSHKQPRPDLPRPDFPPPSLGLQPAWSVSMQEEGSGCEGADGFGPRHDGLDDTIGSELLVCWSFLQSFADLFGVKVPSLEGLLAALAEGKESRLLSDVHCALLRLLQADMEDAHDEKERVGRQTAAAPNFMDRSVVGSARRLEEAWAWGYDVDSWRAHLNVLTWPEVLRQMAVVAGRGRSRPPVRRSAADGTKGPRIQGLEGEDVLDDGSSGGSLMLRMPARYVLGTVKAAAWQVLAGTGPSGLPVAELVRRIQRTGLREMRSSKTPEAVVAGSLARDVLFTRVQPATWALTSVVAFAKRRNEQRRGNRHAAKGGKADMDSGEAGEVADCDGDTDMADVTVKAEGSEPGPEGVKQEHAVKQEAGGSRRRSKVSDADGGLQAMDIDGGAVKHESVKEEGVAVGPVVGLADLLPDSSANGTGGDYGNSRAATSSPGQSAGGVCALPEREADAAETQPESQQQQEGGQQQERGQQQQQQDNEQDDDSYSGDEEDEEGEAQDAERGAGDPWVASLLTGSYSCLGLSDRIAALSFLCHAVLDGPTLRTKLELRTNDAVLRRKQVFEEAKNERRKRQEDASARAAAVCEEARKRAEAAVVAAGTAAVSGAGSRASTPAPLGAPVDPKAIAGEIFGAPTVAPDSAKLAADAVRRSEEEEDEKQKRQQRADDIRRIDEECAIRAEPLGSDRRYNRYWLFTTGEAGDAGSALLWVETAPEGSWRLLTTPQQLDELMTSLEPQGVREGQLAQALACCADRIKHSMPGVAPLPEPLPLDALPDETRSALESAFAARAEVIRLQASAQLGPEDDYTLDLQLPMSDSLRMKRMKRDLLRLEAAIPMEAMDESFQRMAWSEHVQAASSPAALRTCLGQLEAALLPSPDSSSPGLLSTVFHRHPPLVRGAWVEVGKEVATALPGYASKEVLPPVERTDGQPQAAHSDEPLAWLPPTLPALTLRLLSLDASIIYRAGTPPGRESLAGYKYTVRPAPLDAQPAVVAAAMHAAGAVPLASSALPMAVGGGAMVLTNVLADRGRLNHAIRRVPELPPEIMTQLARDFTLPVEEMRGSVAEADKQGLLTAATAAPGGKSKGKGAAAAAAAAIKSAAAAGAKKVGSRSVVVVSGLRGAAAVSKNKGGSKTKGLSAPGVGSRVKGGKSGSSGAMGGGRSKASAAATTEEPEGDDEWMPGTGEQLGEPVLLGPEDEDDLAFSEEDDGQEEGYDDPYDSDYR